jgi:hypothetical protein
VIREEVVLILALAYLLALEILSEKGVKTLTIGTGLADRLHYFVREYASGMGFLKIRKSNINFIILHMQLVW